MVTLDSLDYNPTEDITTILASQGSLDDIDKLLLRTRSTKLQLQKEIEESIQKSTTEPNNTAEGTSVVDDVFQDFQETQNTASKIYSTISELTDGISHLDNAKKNITQSLTIFQNLKILVDSYSQCVLLAESNSFVEMVSPYKIMCSLSESTFSSYKSVTEINMLLSSISRLKSDILNKIKQIFNELLSGKVPGNEKLEVQLRDGACELLDSNNSAKLQIIDWCLNKLLYEIKEIFQLDDEAGSLENLSRRYMFFKKILNNFNSKYAAYFPPSWGIPLALASQFYEITKKDLDVLLRRELQGKTPSIDLFMGSLQVTLDFEKYIDVRFSNKCKAEKLSAAFEPYLSLWVSHQDGMMEKKFLTYMSESKVPENIQDSLVVPSSADLFRTYRSVLSQTLELIGDGSSDGILTSLANFFSKWLIEYASRILRPLLLPDNLDIEDKHETTKYTVLLVNTCDYCSTTISQLEEKLAQLSSNPSNVSKIFLKTKDIYDELLAKGNNLLLKRVIPLDLAFVWKEFDSTDWAHIAVEDYSRYIITLKKVLTFSSFSNKDSKARSKSSLEEIMLLLSRDVFKWNFFDKVIDLVTSNYVDCITRLLQPLPPFATTSSRRILKPKKVIEIGEQLLLDIQLLKEILNSILESVRTGSVTSQSTPFKRLSRHVETNVDLLLHFAKLLVLPLDNAEAYQESYSRLTDDNRDITVWAFIMTLKGITWDLEQWKGLWVFYKTSVKDNNESQLERNLFVFKWDNRHILRFENNLARIQDPAWAAFVKEELCIMPIKLSNATK
ncbi:similar to Saccharomyces cerevisiae YJL029C VPS53 Component of the GARP (Golgi-associated retrograde protein) complex [Maudiozyma barnettii]|uniref:Similar to Saccharomyces cerevisiae YJL029C VPS53 Component of the GARP (Golgi-associated retrograde protein) complex n=1 Tax=Maudiozyma barnettii TaxID=61262 RepID=A0A8H2ZIG5_9SACH|nr:Vps53p [Kazachstania barnettii]CAB4254928.1 similar to Saccharomyces cerevisiae YJL029C VPS53 Component of the GARP (Golgi-associated retrograde protein) complex [Kazachstania barnettii]CAD1783199.1 similar to Saccharomyces cerevisiae YJL029C VPS53 Component of the GARP (Golgi-associated retrograde protein) complex [Kazachstania barnettii]